MSELLCMQEVNDEAEEKLKVMQKQNQQLHQEIIRVRDMLLTTQETRKVLIGKMLAFLTFQKPEPFF